MSRMAAVCILALLAVWPPLTSALTLKIATLAPDGTSWMKAIRQAAEDIKQRSDGRVEFRFYPGGVMGDDTSVLRKIRVGQLQGGALTTLGLAQIFPDAQIYGLPFLFRSYEEVDHMRRQMDDYILQGLDQAGFVGFGLNEAGFAYLLSNKPLQNATDLKGQKVWVPPGDTISQKGLEVFGIAPVTLAIPDVLTGLQTGLIDTVGNSPSGAIALQWHTKVGYLTDVPLYYLYGGLVIQRKAFDKLSKQDQSLVRDTLNAVLATFDQQSRVDNERARQALQKQGITFIQPAPEEIRQWQSMVAPAMEQLGRQGLFGSSALTTLRNHLKTYRER